MVTCRHHLFADITEDGRLRPTVPIVDDSDEAIESALMAMHRRGGTCALDIADKGGNLPMVIAALLNLTVDRVEKIEQKTLDKLACGPLGQR